MKAVFIQQGGGIEVLKVGDMPDPAISNDDQLLVKIHAAGINPVDTKIRMAPECFPVPLPCILGCDGAGVVEQVGKHVRNFKVGDEIYFSQPGFNSRQGTYAEYAVVDSSLAAHKPQSISFEEAAAAPLVLITAWEALNDRAHIKANDHIMIHAGAGGVGHVAIQLAKLVGANVCTSVSNKNKADFVQQLGADKAIFYKDEDVTESVLNWTQQQGVDIAFDTIGGEVLESCFSYTRVYGDVVSILQPTADTNWGEARKRNLRFSQELMLSAVMLELEEAKTHQGNILKQGSKLFDKQKLQLPSVKVFPCSQVQEAHSYLETQHPAGKVVLSFN
ncbi:MAG: zinc-dependent alcohol dehydrogenase family protein [Gammaproteobacteria bacterium]|nr:zinc-dependent alcohol dehydrogenase family protein [Gammaproteobacteria bacterium]